MPTQGVTKEMRFTQGVTKEMRKNARKYWVEFKKQQNAKMMYQQQQVAAYYNQEQPQVYYPPWPEAHDSKGYQYNPYQQEYNPYQHEPQRSDLCVALDCEMVGVGRDGRHSQLARVTLLDGEGKCILDEFIKPTWVITDYRTFVSGITPQVLKERAKMDFNTVRRLVLHHLQGKILIGHDLRNDMDALEIRHPWWMIRDTAWYRPYMRTRSGSDDHGSLWPRGLRELAREKLGRVIQKAGFPHCPREDAKAALDLYKNEAKQWELLVWGAMGTIDSTTSRSWKPRIIVVGEWGCGNGYQEGQKSDRRSVMGGVGKGVG